MSVTSYLELYLAIFGWYMYDDIWLILNDTGIAYLPFIGMFIKNIIEPLKSQEAKDAAGTSLKRIEIDMVAMLTVVVLAAQPFITLTFGKLNYVKACPTVTSVNAGASGTSYDKSFEGTLATIGDGTVKIPIWWYGVIAISGGINNATILRIPCETDLRFLRYRLNSARIKSPKLRREAQKFYKDCFAPAIDDYVEKNGIADIGNTNDIWIGSKHLVDNLYGNYRSKSKIIGFLYDSNRDLEYMAEVHIPTYGKPTCKEWWQDGTYGLRVKLLEQIPVEVLVDLSSSGQLGATETRDAAVRMLTVNESRSLTALQNPNVYSNPGFLSSVSGAVSGAGALLDVELETATYLPKIYLIKMAAPMIQAVLLMMVYMFMPFVLLFSSYRMGTMIFMSIVIFSIKFWTVLWAVSHWLDNHLITSLKPATGSWYDGFFGIGPSMPGDVILSDALIMFITGALYIVAPLFWAGALGWAGYEIGNSINKAASDLGSSAHAAGAKGGGGTYSAAKKAKSYYKSKK